MGSWNPPPCSSQSQEGSGDEPLPFPPLLWDSAGLGKRAVEKQRGVMWGEKQHGRGTNAGWPPLGDQRLKGTKIPPDRILKTQ